MKVTQEQMAVSGKILLQLRGRNKKILADYYGVDVGDIFFLPEHTT